MNKTNIQRQNYPNLNRLIDAENYLIEKGSKEGSSDV